MDIVWQTAARSELLAEPAGDGLFHYTGDGGEPRSIHPYQAFARLEAAVGGGFLADCRALNDADHPDHYPATLRVLSAVADAFGVEELPAAGRVQLITRFLTEAAELKEAGVKALLAARDGGPLDPEGLTAGERAGLMFVFDDVIRRLLTAN